MNYIFIALFVSLLWGTQPVAHKFLLSKYSSTTILLISSFLYFSLISMVAISRNKDIKKDYANMTTRDLLIILAIGLFSGFLGNVLYLQVLKDNNTSIISALIYSSPVFTLIISYLFLKERLNMYGLLGVITIIIGVILVSQNKTPNSKFIDV
jgi:drug/metabolite transporter (DMT)-like permease